MHAAQKFDGTKGIRFVIFAAPYIRAAMEEAIKEQSALYKLPKTEKNKVEQNTLSSYIYWSTSPRR